MKTDPAALQRKKRDQATVVYRDPAFPADVRVTDLLSRMTLEEKAAQMMCVWQTKSYTLVDSEGNFDPAKAQAAFGHGRGIGQVGRPSDAGGGKDPRATAELTNAIQRFFVENSRLGIPVVFHEECLHGQAALGSTSFSQPIGLAATFDPDLVEQLFAMTAREARARGAHQALTPVLDVARDPRWGRVEETYGEDPYLISRMGVAAIRGFQGDRSFRDKSRMMATLKHFAAHGQPESGINCAPANAGERLLREVFLRPFEAAIKEAGAISVMPSYNEIDGVPSHANGWLLRDVLRREWGFEGFVVSDYYAITELHFRPEVRGHAVARDKDEACAMAVAAGVNIELPELDCYCRLADLVRRNVIKESQLDELVAPILLWKFRMGLFDDPYVDPEEAERIVGCDAHRELALQAARETITLLKNEGGLVPLDRGRLKCVAVIGPNAHRMLLGGYSSTPKHNVTVLEGIQARMGQTARVLYSEGCKITVGGSWNEDKVTPSDPAEDRRRIAEAVAVAKEADVVVVALGGNEQTSREAWSFEHLGDRARLELVGLQEELVDALLATGKPLLAFLFNGSPLAIESLQRKVPVIFECWYLGQETGRAVAEVLFGDFNPGGKLPITIPRSAGHLPAFYNYKPTARRGYIFDDVSPLYPFGYGLTYSSFEIGDVGLATQAIRADETTRVRARVANTGLRSGSEVVQMYIRDRFSSVTRPVKELKGFRRVFLEPGEIAWVEFEIGPEQLAFYDIRMERVVEQGEFEIAIGSSSRDADLQTVTLTVL